MFNVIQGAMIVTCAKISDDFLILIFRTHNLLSYM